MLSNHPGTKWEESLEVALIKQEQRKLLRRLPGWFHKPFTLWMLTTIVAGLIGFTYTNYHNCRVQQQSDDFLLTRMAVEVFLRTTAQGRDLRLLAEDKDQSPDHIREGLEKIGVRYMLREFKDQNTVDILLNQLIIHLKYSSVDPNVILSQFVELERQENTWRDVIESAPAPSDFDARSSKMIEVTLDLLHNVEASALKSATPTNQRFCQRHIVWPI